MLAHMWRAETLMFYHKNIYRLPKEIPCDAKIYKIEISAGSSGQVDVDVPRSIFQNCNLQRANTERH
jgi:hypothetical protein